MRKSPLGLNFVRPNSVKIDFGCLPPPAHRLNTSKDMQQKPNEAIRLLRNMDRCLLVASSLLDKQSMENRQNISIVYTEESSGDSIFFFWHLAPFIIS